MDCNCFLYFQLSEKLEIIIVGIYFELQEGMTPLNHLSQGPGSEKLRELLHLHLEEQRKRRAIEACGETKAKMDELENEISKVVGLHELKTQLRKWAKGMLLDERRRALGLKVGTRRPPHMAFLGNPGTGSIWQDCLWLVINISLFSVNTAKFLFILPCYLLTVFGRQSYHNSLTL